MKSKLKSILGTALLLAAVFSSATITTYAGNGTADYTGDGGPATNAILSDPLRLAVDTSGNLFILDGGTHAHIRRADGQTGMITTVVGGGEDPVAVVHAARRSQQSGEVGKSYIRRSKAKGRPNTGLRVDWVPRQGIRTANGSLLVQVPSGRLACTGSRAGLTSKRQPLSPERIVTDVAAAADRA